MPILTAHPLRGCALGRRAQRPQSATGGAGERPGSIIARHEVILPPWRRHLWDLRIAATGERPG